MLFLTIDPICDRWCHACSKGHKPMNLFNKEDGSKLGPMHCKCTEGNFGCWVFLRCGAHNKSGRTAVYNNHFAIHQLLDRQKSLIQFKNFFVPEWFTVLPANKPTIFAFIFGSIVDAVSYLMMIFLWCNDNPILKFKYKELFDAEQSSSTLKKTGSKALILNALGFASLKPFHSKKINPTRMLAPYFLLVSYSLLKVT